MSSLLPVIIQSENINEEVVDPESDTECGGDVSAEEEPLPPKPSVPQEEVFTQEDEKPKKKPKRQITEAQREHLAKARVKAAEVRQRKQQEKKLRLAQEKRAEEKHQKELKPTKTKKKETVIHNPMESDEEDEPPLPVPKKKSINSLDDLDPAFLAKISELAVSSYDMKRKQRKQDKIKKQKAAQEEQATYQAVSNAVNPPDYDFYAQCFQ